MSDAMTNVEHMECRRDLRAEIERLRGRLEQIAVVCTDNMDRSCDHRMALNFVRQIANADEQSAPPEGDNDPNGNRHLAREIDG